ncbi:uncharacterized protein ACR2FA_010459 [Aphomia sociella]
MTSGGSGAVFFLGTRAHYQVLQHPEARSYDAENGNEETIYQNPSVREIWPDQTERDNNGCANERDNWNYCDQIDESDDKIEFGNGVKRRTRRRQSETVLCERDADMRPALLNSVSDNSTPKSKSRRRISPLSFLASLARRRRRLDTMQIQYMQRLEGVLTTCTYRESCRCLECQSRYFDCDESEEYSSDETEYTPRYVTPTVQPVEQFEVEEDDDDEVFVDTVPGDNTSTDMLIEGKEKMSVSSEETEELDESMQLEVAAGTPVLLNYLLTHPITCSIQ